MSIIGKEVYVVVETDTESHCIVAFSTLEKAEGYIETMIKNVDGEWELANTTSGNLATYFDGKCRWIYLEKCTVE